MDVLDYLTILLLVFNSYPKNIEYQLELIWNMCVLKYKGHEGHQLIFTNINSEFMCISCFALFEKSRMILRF